MLEIHKINDCKIIKQLETEALIEYNDKNKYVGVFIDDEVKEFLCYREIDKKYSVLFISDKTKDFQLIFGLVKTLMFLADIAMIDKVSMPLAYERVAKAVRFTNIGHEYELKISDYQKKCGGCC